ncbi:MAG: PAS domain S-box protein [Bacteroidetes bacterium]|nr:MAG: PAS domain S-box protein [Bacteroidota bacterium]
MQNKFFFGLKEFEKIFPFSLTINRGLKIGFVGNSMKKIIGEVEGEDFDKVFKFVRPRMSIEMNFSSFEEHQNMVIILESLHFPVKSHFRGQFLYIESRDEIMYINSPWITDLIDLKFHNLLITDFAIHDPITDHLQLLQSKQMVNDDLNRLLHETMIQRDELIEKNELILGLAKFPDQNPNPIFRIDFKGDLLYANPKAYELLENDSHPFWNEFIPEISGKNVIANKIKDVGGKTFEITIVPFPENQYVNLYLKDVTTILKYENELINLNSRLSAIIENMQVGVLAESYDRKVIMANQLFCDIFGVPVQPSQLEGMDCEEAAKRSADLFINNEHFIERIEQIILDQDPVYGEILKMKDGRILERDFIPVIENGKMNGFIWRYQDVTEIVHHKESLKKVEDKYRKIIENLDFGLIEVDQNEVITKVYPAFCKLVGYTEEELIGQNARDTLAFAEDVDTMDEQVSNRNKGESGVYEVRIKCKSGEVKWVIISGAPIFNETGEVTGSLGIHIDITDRINLQKQLIEAKDQALQSVSLKESFMANMSHEIRTPLHAISGMLELLIDTDLDNEQSMYVNAIRTSSLNLLSIINDILDFAKIESGKMELSFTEVDLNNLVNNVYNSFKPQANEKQLELHLNVDPGLNGLVMADHLKINQVLFNLTHNALKFTTKGEVSINIIVLEENDSTIRVKLEVRDTGKGISEENLKLIFETFVQEDPSISRNFGGSGLGLTICKSLVELMGGELKVESELGVGSIFYFELEFEKMNSIILQDESKGEIEEIDLSSFNILIAEDNEMNQLLISKLLERMNASFRIVGNGAEALSAMKNESFDLILMDIQMPVMDGLTALKKIKEDLRLSVPVVALTANVSAKDQEYYKSVGMDDCLSKPFTSEKLKTILNNVLMKSGAKQVAVPSFEKLNELSNGDQEFIQVIRSTFLTNTSKIVGEIEEALKDKNAEKIGRLAHQLKPSLDLFDLSDLHEMARTLEEPNLNFDLSRQFCDELNEILKNWNNY